MRRATRAEWRLYIKLRNFYPRSPCGERRPNPQNAHRMRGISIHALLAESDTQYKHLLTNIMIFLSTLSLRRATVAPTAATAGGHNFYPRSPCGERHTQNFTALYNIFISIHALLAESDLSNNSRDICAHKFLSTLSLRRATYQLLLEVLA